MMVLVMAIYKFATKPIIASSYQGVAHDVV